MEMYLNMNYCLIRY